MDFKIDTTENYTRIICSEACFDAKLTEAVRQIWQGTTQSGSRNFIIDLQSCTSADTGGMAALHEELYADNHSLVFTNVSESLMEQLKANETDQLINIAPTLQEAIDIVSMEILERDLFNEES